jgi:DNA-directed RNA polymerase specialized sigma24 family protein/ribosome-associated translation inhibitor RaiA
MKDRFMLREIITRGVDAGPRVGEALERCIQKLEKHAARFDSQAAMLRVVLSSQARAPSYAVSARLTIAGGSFFAREDRPDPVLAIRRAFSDLEEQIRRHASLLRGGHERDRVRQTATVLARQLAERAGQEAGVIRPLTPEQIERLQRFIRRELFYRGIESRLPWGVSADGVLDETVVLALEEADLRPERTPVETWLLSLARRALDRQAITERDPNGAHAAVEWEAVAAGVLPPPSDDDLLSFFQPDEDPSVGDVTADTSIVSPEDAFAQRELQAHIHRILGQLPASWRHAFTLCTIEGFPIASVAASVSRDAEEVRGQLQMATEFLREKLRDTGYRGHASPAGGASPEPTPPLAAPTRR